MTSGARPSTEPPPATDDGGRDLFVHYTGIEGSGYRTLSEGQKVEYEATQGQKGPQATKVRVLA